MDTFQYFQVALFLAGYIGIIIEHVLDVHKTAIALVTAVLCWGVYALGGHLPIDHSLDLLNDYLAEMSQIVFFLIGAMIIVELISAHQGFDHIVKRIQGRGRGAMLWIFGITSFILSAFIDNLTTTIAMISIIRQVATTREDRWIFGSLVVIAANAGGAWTPIGDVTTTMLWMGGQVTTGGVIASLFTPSVVSLVVAVLLFQFFFGKEKTANTPTPNNDKEIPTYSIPMLILGIGALVFIPLFKALTGLPPYMGMFIAVGSMWVLTDILHRHCAHRQHLKIPAIVKHIDLSSALFFAGILLSIASLESSGVLQMVNQQISMWTQDERLISGSIGVVSSVIDNVPLVAAAMKMYPLSQYPIDCSFWQLVAFCSGTGGSLLIIGSASGVALMGIEKVSFTWYVRHASLIALLSYLAGLATCCLTGSGF